MNRKHILGLILLLSGAIVGYYGIKILSDYMDPFAVAVEISWSELATLDVQSGVTPLQIKTFLKEDVKIAGFVVPLSDDFKSIKEFLLVPDAMSCIHVPPPPMNQMILVTLEDAMNPQLAYGPVWIKGQLEIKSIQSDFGVVGYQMRAQKVKVYEDKKWR